MFGVQPPRPCPAKHSNKIRVTRSAGCCTNAESVSAISRTCLMFLRKTFCLSGDYFRRSVASRSITLTPHPASLCCSRIVWPIRQRGKRTAVWSATITFQPGLSDLGLQSKSVWRRERAINSPQCWRCLRASLPGRNPRI